MPHVSARVYRRIAAGAALVAALAVASTAPRAHKAITSKYTYNEHVFPVLRDRCGRCHFAGGPTPMSLLTYKDAFPWTESIREQLLSQTMPPWYADPLAANVKGGHAINARELDMLLTWAVGGAPEGDASKIPAPTNAYSAWRGGPPDAVLTMPVAHVMKAGVLESDAEYTMSTDFTAEKWITAVDLQPGTLSMVRSAMVTDSSGRVLAAWVPGDDLIHAPSGSAFRLNPGEKLRVRIHYRKHWQDELLERSDRSSIGIYFGDPPVTGRPIDALRLDDEKEVNGASGGARHTLTGPVRVLGVMPVLDQAYAAVSVDAVLPSGRRISVLRLHAPHPGWSRRYWLAEPLELPASTRLEVVATPLQAPADMVTGAAQRLQVVVDFVRL